jgi:hypothetical protein
VSCAAATATGWSRFTRAVWQASRYHYEERSLWLSRAICSASRGFVKVSRATPGRAVSPASGGARAAAAAGFFRSPTMAPMPVVYTRLGRFTPRAETPKRNQRVSITVGRCPLGYSALSANNSRAMLSGSRNSRIQPTPMSLIPPCPTPFSSSTATALSKAARSATVKLR